MSPTPVSVSKRWINWFRSEFQSAGCLCIRADRTLRRELRGEGQTGRGTWLDRIVCQGKLLLGQQFGHSSQAIRHREDQVTEPAAHLIQGCGSLQDAPSVHSLSFFISFGVRFPISRTPYDRRDCRAGDGSALGGDHDDAGAAGNQVRERDASRRTYYPSKWSSPRLRWTVGIGRTQSKES